MKFSKSFKKLSSGIFIAMGLFIGIFVATANWPLPPNGENAGGWLGVIFDLDKSNSGALVVKGNITAQAPTASGHLTTKEYVDAQGGGSSDLFGQTCQDGETAAGYDLYGNIKCSTLEGNTGDTSLGLYGEGILSGYYLFNCGDLRCCARKSYSAGGIIVTTSLSLGQQCDSSDSSLQCTVPAGLSYANCLGANCDPYGPANDGTCDGDNDGVLDATALTNFGLTCMQRSGLEEDANDNSVGSINVIPSNNVDAMPDDGTCDGDGDGYIDLTAVKNSNATCKKQSGWKVDKNDRTSGLGVTVPDNNYDKIPSNYLCDADGDGVLTSEVGGSDYCDLNSDFTNKASGTGCDDCPYGYTTSNSSQWTTRYYCKGIDGNVVDDAYCDSIWTGSYGSYSTKSSCLNASSCKSNNCFYYAGGISSSGYYCKPTEEQKQNPDETWSSCL